MKPHGLERILIRNEYYFNSYRRLGIILALLLLLNVGLLGFIWYQWLTRPVPKYFPTLPDGIPITLVPFNKPIHSTEFVVNWAEKSVLALYSFDYVTYRKALQDSQNFFTVKGHAAFVKALYESTNLEAVKAKKQVVSAEIIGATKVVREGHISKDSPYSWDLLVPLEITYQNSENQMNKQRGTVVMRVDRGSTLRYPDGIAIGQLVFETTEG